MSTMTNTNSESRSNTYPSISKPFSRTVRIRPKCICSIPVIWCSALLDCELSSSLLTCYSGNAIYERYRQSVVFAVRIMYVPCDEWNDSSDRGKTWQVASIWTISFETFFQRCSPANFYNSLRKRGSLGSFMLWSQIMQIKGQINKWNVLVSWHEAMCKQWWSWRKVATCQDRILRSIINFTKDIKNPLGPKEPGQQRLLADFVISRSSAPVVPLSRVLSLWVFQEVKKTSRIRFLRYRVAFSGRCSW